MTITLLYTVGTGPGGVIEPVLLGGRIDTHARRSLPRPCVRRGAGAAGGHWSTTVERRPLKHVTTPLPAARRPSHILRATFSRLPETSHA
ncbi:hypothetical protein [Ralstonia pseudosolanacearum]|uniref:hypothetical protein n=1 Tax=Ralstonia pseudosolanacearum TaxID=1310165 RepID=UPI001FFA8B12|nr:hypothetical protein [Ralstonia pseudosolanacearum]